MQIVPIKPTPQLLVLALFILAVLGAIGLTYVAALVRFVKGRPLLPDRPGRIVPWGIGSIVMLIVLWVGVQFGVSRVFVSVKNAANPVPAAAGKAADVKATGRFVTVRDQIVLMLVISLFLIPLVPMTLRATSQARREDLGLGTFRLSDMAFGVMGCLILLPVTMLMMILLSRFITPKPHLIMEALRKDHTGGMAVLALVSAVVAAPVLEELFFRGVLLGWLTKLTVLKASAATESVPEFVPGTDADPENPYLAPHSPLENPFPDREMSEFADSRPSGRGALAGLPYAWAIPNVLTSLIFAGLHFPQWPAPIALFPLSLMLGYVYQRTGSLFASMTMHATFNGISMVYLLLAIWSGLPLGPEPEAPPVLKPAPAVVGQADVNPKDSWISGADSPWRRPG